jgi:hypothetical protein
MSKFSSSRYFVFRKVARLVTRKTVSICWFSIYVIFKGRIFLVIMSEKFLQLLFICLK